MYSIKHLQLFQLFQSVHKYAIGSPIFPPEEKWLLPALICCRGDHLTLFSSENIIKTFYFDTGGSPKYKDLGKYFPFLRLLSLK